MSVKVSAKSGAKPCAFSHCPGSAFRPNRQATAGQIGGAFARQNQKAAVPHHQFAPVRALARRPADPFVTVGQLQRRRTPVQEPDPPALMLDDLRQTAPAALGRAQIVLALEQGVRACVVFRRGHPEREIFEQSARRIAREYGVGLRVRPNVAQPAKGAFANFSSPFFSLGGFQPLNEKTLIRRRNKRVFPC